MRRIATVLCGALLLLLLSSGSAAQRTKGSWRDTERLVIEGVSHFDAVDVRNKLLADAEVSEARHPLAPPDEYVRVMVDRCRAGYLRAGFADVKVQGRLDDSDSRVVLTIEGGRRYRCGDVKVAGAVNIEPQKLVGWLAAKQPPLGSIYTGDLATAEAPAGQWVDEQGAAVEFQTAAWQVGEPAKLDTLDEDKLNQAIARALAEQSYPWAKFEVKRQVDQRTGLVQLKIQLSDEGPLAKIERIEVIGNERDSEQEILDFLAAKPGMVVNESLRTSWVYKLWASGRFLRHMVEIYPSEESKVTMRLSLREYKPVTPLREPLSQIEQILLKHRDWLTASEQRQDDWVVSMRGDINARVVLSPRRGVLLHVEANEKSSDAMDDRPQPPTFPEFAVVLSPEELLYANGSLPNKFCISSPATDSTLTLNLKLKAINGPQPSDHKFNLMLGAGINHSADQTTGPLIKFNIRIDPAFALSHAYEHDAKCRIEDGLLRIRTGESALDIDASTGRLVRFHYRRDEQSYAQSNFSVEPDGFAAALAAADRRLSGRISAEGNEYDPAHGYSSFLRVLLDESMIPLVCTYWEFDEELVSRVTRGARALRAVVKHGLLHPLDERLAKADDAEKREEPKNKFEIPKVDTANGDDWLSKFKGPVSSGMICFADEGLPPDSWAAILCRNAGYIGTGKTKYVGEDLKRLWDAKDFGPLGHLSAAEALKFVNPTASQAFASRGLSNLSSELFAADVAPFLAADAETANFLAHLATVLRELSEQEVKDLGELVLGNRGSAIEKMARRLRENRQRPIAEMLPIVLQVAWDEGLRSGVENRLRELAGEEVATKPAQPDQPQRE